MRMSGCGVMTAAVVFLLVLNFVLVSPVRIHRLDVPDTIPNDTDTQVVLDCHYSFEYKEKAGLVVKWFFSDHPSPVYQWIPHNPPQDLGVLRGRLNLSYVASSDLYHKHRAMQILRPTTELSGDYECRVSSFVNEDVRRKTMIVYSPVETMWINITVPDSWSVNVSCAATGIFPQPHLTLYKVINEAGRVEVAGVNREWRHRDGVFDVSLSKQIPVRALEDQTVFGCRVSIPHTSYHTDREVVYYRAYTSAGDLGEASTSCSHLLLLSSLATMQLIIRIHLSDR